MPTYLVPNVFGAKSGNVPASQLDDDFTELQSGVNNAFLVGTLAARPAPDGVGKGRYYFATDDQGGTLYRDNGTAWVKVAAPVAGGGNFNRVATLTTEQLTTSTVVIDLATISGLNIPTTSWAFVYFVARKSSGAAADVGLGLKINTTIVTEAAVASSPRFTVSDEAAQITGFISIPPVATSFLRSGLIMRLGGNGTVNVNLGSDVGGFRTNDRPNAAITSLTIRAITGSTLVTGAVSQMVIYEGVMV